MRIAHYFSNAYFNNDDYDEENVVILEEIQLFDRNTSINEISILKSAFNFFCKLSLTESFISILIHSIF